MNIYVQVNLRGELIHTIVYFVALNQRINNKLN